MPYLRYRNAVILCLVGCACRALAQNTVDFRSWNLQHAVGLLSQSAWARQETYTRVVGGVGSGISGEKEIYSTFFIRFLSARPIREAYARVRQIQADYDRLSPEDRLKLDRSLEPGLRLDVSRWVVVALSFRSNDRTEELRVKNFLKTQTTDTMRPRAYLSTVRIPQVPLAAYFPPVEDEVGAKFVFPRRLEAAPIVSATDSAVAFELDIPGFDPDLRASFPVPEMLVKGEPVL